MESTKILELVVLAQFSCKSCVCCSLHICHNNIYVYLSPFDLFWMSLIRLRLSPWISPCQDACLSIINWAPVIETMNYLCPVSRIQILDNKLVQRLMIVAEEIWNGAILSSRAGFQGRHVEGVCVPVDQTDENAPQKSTQWFCTWVVAGRGPGAGLDLWRRARCLGSVDKDQLQSIWGGLGPLQNAIHHWQVHLFVANHSYTIVHVLSASKVGLVEIDLTAVSAAPVK